MTVDRWRGSIGARRMSVDSGPMRTDHAHMGFDHGVRS